MAQKQLPPAFQGIDFQSWPTWETVVIDGLPYRKIPGNDSYVFDPADGSFGSIKVNPKQIELSVQEQLPKEPSLANQLAAPIGLVGGLYGAKEIFGKEAAKEGGKAAGGILDGIFGNSVEVAGAADTTGVAAGQGSGILGAPTGVEANFVETGAVPGLLEAAPGTVGAGILPALGVAAGAYTGYQSILGAKNAFQDKKLDTQQKLALALPTFGLSLFSDQLGIGRPSTKEIQQKRRDDLIKQNVTGYQNYATGNTFDVRPEIDKGFDQSRNESMLTPEQVWGSEAMFETFGNDWLGKYDEAQRREISNRLIQSGGVRESRGGLYVDDKDKAKTIANEVIGGGVPAKSPLGQSVATAIQRPIGFDEVNGRFVRR